MFRDSVRGFLDASYRFGDSESRLGPRGVDRNLWDGLTRLGVFSLLVPEAHGGLGLSLVDLSLVLEAFGGALVPLLAPETIAATDLLARYATEEQKSRLLPSIAQGTLSIVAALAEQQSGFDPEEIALTATPAQDGWRVSGSKILVPHAMAADLLLVAARFGGEGRLGLLLVEPERDGIALRAHGSLDASSRFCEATFNGCAISRADVLGGGPAPESVWRLFDVAAMIAATQLTGIAAKMLEMSVDYARQRTQFDAAIGSFQAIKHRCADMIVRIESSRSAAYYAAWALSDGPVESGRAASMAKSYCGEAARFACNEGIQIHGGVGFTWDLGLHFYLRRAKALEYTHGDAAYHRERVLAATLAEMSGKA